MSIINNEEINYSGRWVQRVPKHLHQKLANTAKSQGVSLNMLVATMLAEGIVRTDTSSTYSHSNSFQNKKRVD